MFSEDSKYKYNWQKCLLFSIVVIIFTTFLPHGQAWGCNVTSVSFYVAETESDANEKDYTTIILCDQGDNFWVRVEWRAKESGPEGNEDFDIRIIEQDPDTDEITIYDSTQSDINDGPARPQIHVFEVSGFSEGECHHLFAEVKRDGTSHWERSDKCYVIDGDASDSARLSTWYFMPRPSAYCPPAGSKTISDSCNQELKLTCTYDSLCSPPIGYYWLYEHRKIGDHSWHPIGKCVWEGGVNNMRYKKTMSIKTLFLRSRHESGNDKVGIDSDGEGCAGWYCWRDEKRDLCNGTHEYDWWKSLSDFIPNFPSPSITCTGTGGDHECYPN